MEHLGDIVERRRKDLDAYKDTPTASSVLEGGATLLEMVHDASPRNLTSLALWKEQACSLITEYRHDGGSRLMPYQGSNNLVAHRVVLFPSSPEEYGTDAQLIEAIRAYIHRYVDLSPLFERIATYYVLLSWLYDTFNELPYLRVRGEPGSGKTRFLLTVGSICYKPIFASGASTVSPIFRILDAMQGTLVLDESDFRMSDERAEIVKILNNGNVRGFPVLRTEQVPGTKEFNPRAYHVFGPKIIATRGSFDDPALESRFLSERMESDRLRRDIPISLPKEHAEGALHLRNQLLLFRFRNYAKPRKVEEAADRSLEPRLAQIFAPLLSIVEDEETKRDLKELAQAYGREMIADRSLQIEAAILGVIRGIWRARVVTVKEVTEQFIARHGAEYPMITPKRIGGILRRNLGLATERQNGVYVLAPTEGPKLLRLFSRYGLAEEPGSQATNGSPQRPPSPGDLSAHAA
jgi:hypothetical protein